MAGLYTSGHSCSSSNRIGWTGLPVLLEPNCNGGAGVAHRGAATIRHRGADR